MSSIRTTNHVYGASPLTGWSLFINLAQGHMKPGPYWSKNTNRRKFVVRSLSMPFHTHRYLTDMVNNPWFYQLIKAQPGLPCRLHRPWMKLGISQSQKLNAINHHYTTFCQALPKPVIDNYFAASGALLAEITGKNQETFSVKLLAEDYLGKEGEATLQFSDAQGTILAQLTFTLIMDNNKQTIFIGGLQGARNFTPHEVIQAATKSCHGLFPKRLLTEAVMNLAKVLGVRQIVAVSNQTHIYSSWRYKSKKKDKFSADYDEFWQSLGASLNAKGDFILPLQIPRKLMEEIASKKRAEYRRRYELLDQLQQQMLEHCQQPG